MFSQASVILSTGGSAFWREGSAFGGSGGGGGAAFGGGGDLYGGGRLSPPPQPAVGTHPILGNNVYKNNYAIS